MIGSSEPHSPTAKNQKETAAVKKLFGNGVMSIYALWAFALLVMGATIQSGSLLLVSGKIWFAGGSTFGVVLIITIVCILKKRDTDNA